MKTGLLFLMTAAASSLLLSRAASAQDPVKVAPNAYQVLLENEHVRVLDVRLPAGGKSPMHSHPAYVVYALSDGKVRFTPPKGKPEEIDIKAGQATWRPAETHAVENIGPDVHVLNIELKGAPHRRR